MPAKQKAASRQKSDTGFSSGDSWQAGYGIKGIGTGSSGGWKGGIRTNPGTTGWKPDLLQNTDTAFCEVITPRSCCQKGRDEGDYNNASHCGCSIQALAGHFAEVPLGRHLMAWGEHLRSSNLAIEKAGVVFPRCPVYRNRRISVERICGIEDCG